LNRQKAIGLGLLLFFAVLVVAVFWTLVTVYGNLWVATYGTTTAATLTLFIIALQNLDRTSRVLASLLASVSWLGSRIERSAVANRIRGSIGAATKKINSEGGTPILPHDVQVQWVKPKEVERDSFIREGKVVVLLEHHRNDARNLARATSLFVSGGLIPSSRIYVHPLVMKAADITVARRILLTNGRLDAVECFNQEFVAPALKDTPHVGNYVSEMEEMDSQGTFTRILMREYSTIWTSEFPHAPSNDVFQETIKLANILGFLATRKPGQQSVLDLEGAAINTHIIPVARGELVSGADISNHLKAARLCHMSNGQTIYVMARSNVNIAMAEVLVQAIVGEGLYVLENASRFRGRTGKMKFDGYVAAMRIKKV